MDRKEMMWRGSPDALKSARATARELQKEGDRTWAHSTMLSAYITVYGRKKKLSYIVLGLWHAIFLCYKWRSLDQNELDVLIQFLLKFRSRLPFMRMGRPMRSWHSVPAEYLFAMVRQEVTFAERTGNPQQMALAYMTRAEVIYAMDFSWPEVEKMIRQALALESRIRKEPDQLQALRQFVRVLKKAGHLYRLPGMNDGTSSNICFRRALEMAKGEANTPDQVAKIEALMRGKRAI